MLERAWTIAWAAGTRNNYEEIPSSREPARSAGPLPAYFYYLGVRLFVRIAAGWRSPNAENDLQRRAGAAFKAAQRRARKGGSDAGSTCREAEGSTVVC